MAGDVDIRVATPEDAEACLAIYAPYVTGTAITFETAVPTCEEFAGRIRSTLARYPWLVAQRDGRIVGYAYAGRFKSRAAYDWSAELSIYVAADAHRAGIGRALYTELERLLRKMGIVNLYACIVYPRVPDEFADYNSYDFHLHLGFEPVCVFEDVASKFGRWYGAAWVRKVIGGFPANPPAPTRFPNLER